MRRNQTNENNTSLSPWSIVITVNTFTCSCDTYVQRLQMTCWGHKKNLNEVLTLFVMMQEVSCPSSRLPETNVLEIWRCSIKASGVKSAPVFLQTKMHKAPFAGSYNVDNLAKSSTTSDLGQATRLLSHSSSVLLVMAL